MDKQAFLIAQYDLMMASGAFVVEQWRSSRDRFVADMWDRTPTQAGKRHLQPIDGDLGFAPDNVEWCFPRITARPKGKRAAARRVSPTLTKVERKATEQAAKEAKRKAIADEFQRWEAIRRSRVL